MPNWREILGALSDYVGKGSVRSGEEEIARVVGVVRPESGLPDVEGIEEEFGFDPDDCSDENGSSRGVWGKIGHKRSVVAEGPGLPRRTVRRSGCE